MKHPREYYVNKMKPIARFVYRTKTARFWADGDTVAFRWNYWNPIAWPFVIVVFVAEILVAGISGLQEDKHDLGFTVSPYWKRNEREFL